jgi:hypothetical protein
MVFGGDTWRNESEIKSINKGKLTRVVPRVQHELTNKYVIEMDFGDGTR